MSITHTHTHAKQRIPDLLLCWPWGKIKLDSWMKFTAGRRKKKKIVWIRARKCCYINLMWARSILQHLWLRPTPLHSEPYSRIHGRVRLEGQKSWLIDQPHGPDVVPYLTTTSLMLLFWKCSFWMPPPQNSDYPIIARPTCSFSETKTQGTQRMMSEHVSNMSYWLEAAPWSCCSGLCDALWEVFGQLYGWCSGFWGCSPVC